MKKKAVIAGLVAVIVVLLGVIIYLLLSQKEPEAEQPRNMVVTPENVDEVIEQMEEDAKTPPGAYTVSMNTDWTFPDGKSVSTDAYVENNVSNTNTVYFTIALSGEEEEIYHSPYMEVGSRLENIQLDEELPKGEYAAVITYHLVDDDFEDLSQVSLNMKIIVEN